MNYALHTAAISPGIVLIAVDTPHPTNLADEADRVLYTLTGVGIAVLVTLLATELHKRTSRNLSCLASADFAPNDRPTIAALTRVDQPVGV